MSTATAIPYWQKLRDPRWQRKRLEIMERDGFMCCWCDSGDSTLNVHHGYYEKGLEPWEYDSETLWTLCESCHQHAETYRKAVYRLIAQRNPWEVCSWHFEAERAVMQWPMINPLRHSEVALANAFFSQEAYEYISEKLRSMPSRLAIEDGAGI